MKFNLLFLLSVFSISAITEAADQVVHHPVPKKPVFVSETWYESLKTSLPLAPLQNSAQQKSDEQELFKYQKTRKAADCEQAKVEVMVSLSNFFGSKGSPIPMADIEKLSPFFEQLRNDAHYFIQRLKKDFPRQRPFLYLKGLEPCVAKEVTGAYPSGHAVLAELFGLVLTDFYPEHKKFLETRAKKIAEHRVLAGMHHRTDIEAGTKLGALIYEQFKKSGVFQGEFTKNKVIISRQK
jgi:acid phosphatase (class A)